MNEAQHDALFRVIAKLFEVRGLVELIHSSRASTDIGVIEATVFRSVADMIGLAIQTLEKMAAIGMSQPPETGGDDA